MSSPQDDGKTTTIQITSDVGTNDDELKEQSTEVTVAQNLSLLQRIQDLELNAAELKEKVEIDEDELFHVYSGHKISGPHYPNDIMKMFFCGEISDVFWVIRGDDATGDDTDEEKWCKVHLSHEDTEDNKQFKSTYPKLYNYVNSKLNAKLQLKTFNRPMAIPNGTKSAVKGTKRCVKILGVILIIIFSIFIGLHALVPGCCGIILWFITYESDSHGGKVAAIISTVLTYSGLIIIPLIIVYVLLLDTVNAEEWDSQIQSWMIAYIAWGISSYLLVTLILALVFVGRVSDFDSDNALNQLWSGIFWIIGVDLGDVSADDLTSGGDKLLLCCVLWVFPCLASLLPAAIIGFISNFILEEKFELKCNDEIQSDIENVMCYDGFGCCEVISSHDYSNMYGFMGGLASNILATWAIIRIVGFLMTSASSSASLYAKKKKKKNIQR
eukprot:709870_1